MKKYLLLFIAAFACVSLIHAQGLGYLGKRYRAGIDFSYGYSGIELIPINTQYGLFADVIMSRKFEMGLSGFIFNTKCFSNFTESKMKLKGSGVMLKSRFYLNRKGGAIAPIGKYLEVAMTYTKATLYWPGEPTSTETLPPPGSFIVPSAGFGLQTVLFDCLSVDAGMRIGLIALPAGGDVDLKRDVFNKNFVLMSTRIAYLF